MIMLLAGMEGGCGQGDEGVAYVIKKVGADMRIDGEVNKPQWRQAQEVRIEQNPFGDEGTVQPTTAKVVYNDEALFLLFVCQDNHIVARQTRPNGPVSEDDCVEFFASPRPGESTDYFNLEINCVGTVLLHYGPECKTWDEARAKRKAEPKQTKRLEIFHSVPGPRKKAAADDKQWLIECKVPFAMLEDFAGIDRPRSGTVWRANLYRCGSKVGEVNASWLKLDKEGLGFHQPRCFGLVRFE